MGRDGMGRDGEDERRRTKMMLASPTALVATDTGSTQRHTARRKNRRRGERLAEHGPVVAVMATRRRRTRRSSTIRRRTKLLPVPAAPVKNTFRPVRTCSMTATCSAERPAWCASAAAASACSIARRCASRVSSRSLFRVAVDTANPAFWVPGRRQVRGRSHAREVRPTRFGRGQLGPMCGSGAAESHRGRRRGPCPRP